MANATSAAAICCLTLSLLLKEKISYPGSQTYSASLGSYFSLQQTEVKPSCIVSPASTQDVSNAIIALTTPFPSCQIAVRSGGHSSFVGASNNQGGVTMDLRGLDGVELSQDRSSVSLGVGATWGKVYSQLDSLNRSVAGGRASSIGIGGLSIGGGISYFSPRYGWTCDMVTNYVVVLANGSVVNANRHENSDLLWALRGGTNNFGIVARVDMDAFEQGSLWGGSAYHALSVDGIQEHIDAIAEFNRPEAYDEFSSLITSFGYFGSSGVSFIVDSMEYTQGVADPAVFQRFKSMTPLQSTMRITNMTDLATETDMLQAKGSREGYATLTIESTHEALNATVSAWNSSLTFVKNIPGIVWTVVLEPLPPSLYAQHAENNALGLTERHDKALMVVLLSTTWSNAEDDEKIEKESRALIGIIEREVGKLGKLDPFIYLNYAASWQKPISSYGKESVERLRRVRNDYDPQHIFTDFVPGGFKIPE